MKRFLIFMTVCLLSFSFVSVNAQTVKDSEQLEEKFYIKNDDTELEKVKQAVNENKKKKYENTNVTFEPYIINKALKVYLLDDYFLTEYEKTKDVNSIFSEECYWIVTENNDFSGNSNMTVEVNNKKAELTGVAPDFTDVISFENLGDLMTDFGIKISDIKEIKLCESKALHSFYVLIYTNSEIYSVEYQDINYDGKQGALNKTVYPLSEMLTLLYNTYDETALYEGNSFSILNDLYTRIPHKTDTLFTVISIAVILFFAVTSTVVFFNLNKKQVSLKRIVIKTFCLMFTFLVPIAFFEIVFILLQGEQYKNSSASFFLAVLYSAFTTLAVSFILRKNYKEIHFKNENEVFKASGIFLLLSLTYLLFHTQLFGISVHTFLDVIGVFDNSYPQILANFLHSYFVLGYYIIFSLFSLVVTSLFGIKKDSVLKIVMKKIK